MTTPALHSADLVATLTAVTLSAGVETDLLVGTTSGADPQGCDVLKFVVQNTGTSNSINTLSIYASVQGSTNAPAAFSTTWSVSAKSGSINGVKTVEIRGYNGGPVRLTAKSTSGTTCITDAQFSRSNGDIGAYKVIVDGTEQAGSFNAGTVSGNFSQSSGTFSASATGSAVLDASTSVTVAGTNATSLVLGASGIVPSLPGGVSVASGKAVTGSGAMAVEATGALSLGVNASTTSIVVGQATVPLDLKGGFTVASGDAGAAGTTGTVSKRMGTFTLTGTTFTLTNTTIATGDLAWVSCITAAPGAYIASAVVSGSAQTLTVTFSTSVTAIKCAFLLSAAG